MSSHSTTISILVAITGLIHLGIGIVTTLANPEILNIMLILNGLGYFGLLLAIYYLPMFKKNSELFRKLLIIFTVITFVSYFVIFLPEGIVETLTNPVGMLAKLVEVAIIVLEIRYKPTTEM